MAKISKDMLINDILAVDAGNAGLDGAYALYRMPCSGRRDVSRKQQPFTV